MFETAITYLTQKFEKVQKWHKIRDVYSQMQTVRGSQDPYKAFVCISRGDQILPRLSELSFRFYSFNVDEIFGWTKISDNTLDKLVREAEEMFEVMEDYDPNKFLIDSYSQT